MKFRSTLQHVIVAAFAALPIYAAYAGAPAEAKAYQSAAEIPVEVFFKLTDYRDLSMSPDGKTIAAIVPLNGRGNLVLIDLATRKAKVITSSPRFDVAESRWVGNKYLFYRTADGQEARGRFVYKGSYYYDIDNDKSMELENTNERKKGDIHIDSIIMAEGNDSPEAYVSMRGRSKEYADVYKFNFKTRRSQLLTFESPGRTEGWELDTHKRPRIAQRGEIRPAAGQPQMTAYYHRPIDSDKWEKIFEQSSYNDGTMYDVLGFDNDDRTLYVSTNKDGLDKMALFKYDTVTKKFGELVHADPIFDINGQGASARLIRESNDENGKVVGLYYDAAKPTRIWFGDSARKSLSEQIDASLPATYNAFRLSSDGSKALVHATSDIQSGIYYLFDTQKKTLEPIVQDREWANPALMAERKYIGFKARDGLPVYGYLTLPKGTEAKNLPLIMNIHGGPMVRGYHFSSWGRWPEAQFFASRGYAVLELEPRGSEGYGRNHYVKAWKQWGGTMQDDINDGAMFLVQEGIVDKKRMALMGGSYGGYASLQGMTRDPDLWRCASSVVAVSDLGLLQNVSWSDTSELADAATGGYLNNEFKLWVGDSKADAALFELRSPARNAANVKGPIMLTMGSDDRRVPLIHGEKMRDALLKAGKTLDYKVYPEEGHGFNKDVNVFDLYNRSEKFFAQCLKK
ncbi:prolyl oligopeptidase family serine peptidase [Undibacterium sp. TC4M20W]|uniref:alpha/beta hydrolase family protein n=1 Tax=Undibacterium sp. TC4M20W TaxID=3413052 RepID=UPI003BF42E96